MITSELWVVQYYSVKVMKIVQSQAYKLISPKTYYHHPHFDISLSPLLLLK